jgi:integrase
MNPRKQSLKRVDNLIENSPLTSEDGDLQSNSTQTDGRGGTTFPIAKEDYVLIKKFKQNIREDKNKGISYQTQLLCFILTFAKSRHEPVPNGGSSHGVALNEFLECADAAETVENWLLNEAAEENDRFSQNSRRHIRNALRRFGTLMGEGGCPPHIEDFSHQTGGEDTDRDEYNPAPHPSEVIHWDPHIISMCDHPQTRCRDVAIVTTLWDGGSRPWEHYDLRRKDVEDLGKYIKLTIQEGKTGTRDFRLLASAPYLRKWLEELNEFTDGDSIPPQTPIWTHLDKPKQITLDYFQRLPKNVGETAGIDVPTNSRQFRKSRASVLAASPKVTEEALRTRFGWTPKSDAPAHYKARFGKKSDEQIFAADGSNVNLTENRDDPAPVTCPRCSESTPAHREDCIWCTASFDSTEADEAGEPVIEKENELNNQKAQLLTSVAKNEISPDALETAESFANVLSDDPNIVDKAKSFLDEVEN